MVVWWLSTEEQTLDYRQSYGPSAQGRNTGVHGLWHSLGNSKQRKKDCRWVVTQCLHCSKENHSWGIFVSLPFLYLQKKKRMEGQTQFVVSQCFTEFHEVASRIFPNGRGRGFRSPGCVFYFHLMDIFQAIRQVHFIHLQGTHIIILLMKLQVTQEGTLQGGGVSGS